MTEENADEEQKASVFSEKMLIHGDLSTSIKQLPLHRPSICQRHHFMVINESFKVKSLLFRTASIITPLKDRKLQNHKENVQMFVSYCRSISTIVIGNL